MITEVRTKIFTLGSSVTGLTGGFYYLEAPQKTAKPYAVFSSVANPVSRDTASKFEEIYWQVNLYGEDLTALELIAKKFREEFEDSESSWSLTAYHLDRIEFESSREAKYEKIFQITQQYKLELTKL